MYGFPLQSPSLSPVIHLPVHIANLNKSEAQQDEEKDGGDGGSVPRPEIRECFLVDLVHQRGRAGCLRATPGHY